MENLEPNELVSILQTAISPVVLVSGVGLLLLSMTNRFARTTDRVRVLARQLKESDYERAERIHIQIRILYRRSQILLCAITLSLVSVLFVSLLVICLFGTYLLNINLQGWAVVFFVISLLCLVVSVLLFIQDMSLSLKAIREELKGQL